MFNGLLNFILNFKIFNNYLNTHTRNPFESLVSKIMQPSYFFGLNVSFFVVFKTLKAYAISSNAPVFNLRNNIAPTIGKKCLQTKNPRNLLLLSVPKWNILLRLGHIRRKLSKLLL